MNRDVRIRGDIKITRENFDVPNKKITSRQSRLLQELFSIKKYTKTIENHAVLSILLLRAHIYNIKAICMTSCSSILNRDKSLRKS